MSKTKLAGVALGVLLVASPPLAPLALATAEDHMSSSEVSTPLPSGGSTTLSSSPTGGGGEEKDCDDAVAQQQEEAYTEDLDNEVTLAEAIYDTLEDAFGKLSCLDNIFNIGLDALFSSIDLNSIIKMFTDFVCNKANQMMAKATRPINQALGELSGKLNETVSLNDMLPGLNIGPLRGGINMRLNNTGAINIRGVTSRKNSDWTAVNGGASQSSGLDALFSRGTSGGNFNEAE